MSHRLLHSAASLLRRARLLGAADSALYVRSLLRERQANARFRAAHPDFVVPPAHLAFDAYGNVNNEAYVASGEAHARMIADIINRHLSGEEIRVCEWGCGPARVIRHLGRHLNRSRARLYGTDYNRETIAWASKHLEGIEFLPNELAPPLPFEDGYLDCVYAISVFTHLSERSHFEWINELRRVLRPGGIIAVTTHSDASAARLLAEEGARYAEGKLVVRGQVREGKKWYLAYQPPEFMRDRLLVDWTILGNFPFSTTQEVWIARP